MTTEKWEDRQPRNRAHAVNPEVGDYWHEMFSPIRIVLAVNSTWVTICDKTKAVDDNCWEWDLGKARSLLKEDFGNGLFYKSAALKHKTHCDVVPRRMMDVVECWIASASVHSSATDKGRRM